MALTLDFDPSGHVRRPQQETSLEADRRRAFVAARRHTAVVRLMRYAFPVAAIGVVAYYGLSLAANFTFGSGQLRLGPVEITADDLTMKNPSYFGTTQDGGRYEVRAKKAIMELSQTAPIKLVDIDGDMIQANQVKTLLKARRGLFDNAKNELELFDGIEIDSSNGMRARMTRAMIYAKENRVVSKQPVVVSSPTGTIRGASMTLNTASNQATFLGNVSVRLTPADPPGAPAAAKQQQPSTPAFGRDSRQPVDVRSERFDLDDAKHRAVFTGDVVATQGDSVLRAPELHVTYEGKATEEFANPGAQPGGAASGLTRLFARTGVVVTAGPERRVTSDTADFDAKADTALFVGNVLVNQGKNKLQGRRLFLDRKSGRTRLESPPDAGVPAGRITASFYQSEQANPPTPAAKSKGVAQEIESGAQSMMGTFKADPTAPMDIEADNLEVLETSHQATFRGAVKAQQGDFVVKAPEMVAFFTGQAGLGMGGTGTNNDPAKGSQITRVEARQKVEITSKEGQTAKGDWATFDIKANTVLLGGHVVVTRGKDIAQGPRLKIDLTTGMYRFELDEKSAAAVANAPPTITAPVPRPAKADPSAPDPLVTRQCPPGKQCVLFYPKEAQEKAGEILKKSPLQPPAAGWEPSMSASPVQRGQ